MRAYRLAAIAGALGCACSLITHLDPPNDGGSGGDGGPLCVPVVIADVGASAMVTSLVADTVSSRVYFSGTASGGVYAVPLDAGADTSPATLATFVGPRRLATAQVKVNPESYVYVTTIGGADAGGGVYSIASDGGTSPIVGSSVTLDGSTTQVHAYGLATSGPVPATLYWASGTQVFTTSPSNVTSVFATIDAAVHDIVLTPTTPWWDTQTTQTMFTFASDGGLTSLPCAGVMLYVPQSGDASARVYYSTDAKCSSSQNAPEIDWVSTDLASKGTLSTNAASVDSPTSLAFDGTYLYWANQQSQSIYRVDPTTTDTPTFVAMSPGSPHQLAIANGVLYWTIDSGLVRCAL
jgi:hypothetical protein